MNPEKTLFYSKDEDRRLQLASFVRSLGSTYATTLFLFFSVTDYFWYPTFFQKFFIIRLIVVSIVTISAQILKNEKLSLLKTELISCLPFLACSAGINTMIYLTQDPKTPYWAGLSIIVAGLATGFRFSWKFYFVILSFVLIPFLSLMVIMHSNESSSAALLNFIFLAAVSLVATVGRWFFEKLNDKEFLLRQNLANEIELRNSIIEEKTKESVRLYSLSKQFSPQILDAIKNGAITFNGQVHRADICAIFVDIKDSTTKFINLDRDDLQRIISMYMEDVMSTFLKYDITIDKFLGDGVLGFTNDPVKQSDFIERAIMAAMELKNKFTFKQDQYIRYWGSTFEYRIGIASGYASVGFYGSDKHVKSYTAIGKVINLSNRVNGIAQPNDVTLSQDVLTKLQENNASFLREYTIDDLGTPLMKGFETEKIKIYSIRKTAESNISTDAEADSCPSGHGPVVMSQTSNGIYIMKCRYCDYVLDPSQMKTNDVAQMPNRKIAS